jgi:hypothetical protein
MVNPNFNNQQHKYPLHNDNNNNHIHYLPEDATDEDPPPDHALHLPTVVPVLALYPLLEAVAEVVAVEIVSIPLPHRIVAVTLLHTTNTAAAAAVVIPLLEVVHHLLLEDEVPLPDPVLLYVPNKNSNPATSSGTILSNQIV